MIRRELAVDERVGLAKRNGVVSAIVFCLLLLDDVGTDRHTEVVGLPSQVRRGVEVPVISLETRVAEIAPEHGEHTEAVCFFECRSNLLKLTIGLF